MRWCFGGGGPQRSAAGIPTTAEEEGEGRESLSPSPSSASITINLRQEYALAFQTNSYNEAWSNLVTHQSESESQTIDRLLHPDRGSIQEALRLAGRPDSPLTRLASLYFDTSELTTRLCFAIHCSIDRTRTLYAPITQLLDIVTAAVSPAQRRWAFDTLLAFHQQSSSNPFPSPSDLDASLSSMHGCFADLRPQLDLRLLRARRRHRLLRRATRVPAACLIAAVAALASAALALAAHALAALTASLLLLIPSDLLGGPRRRVRDRMARLDAAARGAFVLNNDLATIEQLVARLHAAVEADRALVRLGVQPGTGDRHLIDQVLRHLRANHSGFLQQLQDLDEHVCLCFAAVNRARSLLLHQIHHT